MTLEEVNLNEVFKQVDGESVLSTIMETEFQKYILTHVLNAETLKKLGELELELGETRRTDHCKDLAQKAAEYAGILAVQYSTHILGKMQPIIMENLSNMLSESSTKSVETSTPGHMVLFTKVVNELAW